jgi:hypothetical protein
MLRPLDFRKFRTNLQSGKRIAALEEKMCCFNVLRRIPGEDWRSPWPQAKRDSRPSVVL